MKYKQKTIFIKRAREAKLRRNYYYGVYLPLAEGMIKSGSEKMIRYN